MVTGHYRGYGFKQWWTLVTTEATVLSSDGHWTEATDLSIDGHWQATDLSSDGQATDLSNDGQARI